MNFLVAGHTTFSCDLCFGVGVEGPSRGDPVKGWIILGCSVRRTTFSSPTNHTSARLCRTSTSAQSSGSGTGLCRLIKFKLRNHEQENLDLLYTMTTPV